MLTKNTHIFFFSVKQKIMRKMQYFKNHQDTHSRIVKIPRKDTFQFLKRHKTLTLVHHSKATENQTKIKFKKNPGVGVGGGGSWGGYYCEK